MNTCKFCFLGAILFLVLLLPVSVLGQEVSLVSGVNFNKTWNSPYVPGLNTALLWQGNIFRLLNYKTGIGFQQIGSPGIFAADCTVGEPEFVLHYNRIKKEMIYVPLMLGTDIRLHKKAPFSLNIYAGTALQVMTNYEVSFWRKVGTSPEFINIKPIPKSFYFPRIGFQFQACSLLEYAITPKLEAGIGLSMFYAHETFGNYSKGGSALLSLSMNLP